MKVQVVLLGFEGTVEELQKLVVENGASLGEQLGKAVGPERPDDAVERFWRGLTSDPGYYAAPLRVLRLLLANGGEDTRAHLIESIKSTLPHFDGHRLGGTLTSITVVWRKVSRGKFGQIVESDWNAYRIAEWAIPRLRTLAGADLPSNGTGTSPTD